MSKLTGNALMRIYLSFPSPAPEGLAAPTLSLVDATTLLVEWSAPSQPNGIILSYQFSVINSSHSLTFDVGLNMSATIGSLIPFTLYEVFVGANNSVGGVNSPAINITTGMAGKAGVLF